jgi:Domain of unknown function (DUF4395)
MAAAALRKVDHSGLKTGQAITIVLLLVGFVLNSSVLVAIVALAQFLAAVDSSYAPYRLIYQRIVKPSGLVKPHVVNDNPEPHRFAMGIGAVFNTVATLLLLAGATTPAWVLVWIVIALANLNLWINFCAGCLMYYQLHKLGVPGFTRSPLPES